MTAAAVALSVAAPADAGTRAAAASDTVHYAVDVPACPQSTQPHVMSCYAMIRMPAAQGTKGAYAVATPAFAKGKIPAGCNGTNPIALGPGGGYTPADLAAAYQYNAAAATPTQTVAVVDWYDDPNIAKDLASFDACYGFPKETATSFVKVNQLGQAKPLPKRDANEAVETTLDVESVRAVCHTCTILLVEARSPTDTNVAAAENRAVAMGATEVSDSFGEPEAHIAPSILAAYNHPGVVITASTGDHGWFGWDFANGPSTSQNAPSFPSTDPSVVSVGGTELLLNANGTRGEEVVWNENGVDDQTGLSMGAGLGAGGSGCSSLYGAQAWQATYPGYDGSECSGKRLAADISAIADPSTGFDIYDTFGHSGWLVVGGTSLSSPVVAAMYALAGGAGTAEYPSSSLYVNAAHLPSSAYDVVPTSDSHTSGNSFCGGSTTLICGTLAESLSGTTHNPNALGGGNVDCSFPRNLSDPAVAPALDIECNTAVGLDGPTGLGTPNGLALLTNTAPSITLAPPAHLTHGISVKFDFTVHETVPGIDPSATFSYVWGDGRQTRAGSNTTHHTYAAAGTYTITVTATDSAHQIVVESFPITIS